MAALKTVTLVARIRSLLGDRPWQDNAAGSLTTTGTTLAVTDGTMYGVGNIIEFADGEQVLVTSISSNNLTVQRNYNYSVTTTAGTGTAHSNGDTFFVDPDYFYVDITREIEGVISELWPMVWATPTATNAQAHQVSITTVVGQHWYDLDTSAANALLDFELGMVTQLKGTGAPYKIATYGDQGGIAIRLRHGISSTLATYKTGIYFGHFDNYSNPVLVNIVRPITTTQTVAGTYDDLDDTTPAAECLVYLVASKLVVGREVRRSTNRDVSQGDASVAPGYRTNIAEYLRRMGERHKVNWHYYCQATWPKLPRSRFYKVDGEYGGKF